MDWISNASTRISSLAASHVSSSYSAQIACMLINNARIVLFVISHVSRLNSTQQVCVKPMHEYHQLYRVIFRVTSNNTRNSSMAESQVSILYSAQIRCISSVCASHIWRPYSAQICSRTYVNDRISWLGASHFWSPYSVRINCMWSAKTRILPLDASNVLGLYSAHLGCNMCGNTRISSLGDSHVWSHFRHR